MNDYIIAHVLNVQALVRNFEQACNQAALKDDQQISREEEKALKIIQKATERFVKDLNKAIQ